MYYGQRRRHGGRPEGDHGGAQPLSRLHQPLPDAAPPVRQPARLAAAACQNKGRGLRAAPFSFPARRGRMAAWTGPIIRPGRPADIAAIAAIYADAVSDQYRDVRARAARRSRDRRSAMRVLTDAGYPYLVAEHDGVVLGYAYAGSYRPRIGYRYTVEDSIYLAPEARGQGIGGALLRPSDRGVRGRRLPPDDCLHRRLGATPPRSGCTRAAGFAVVGHARRRRLQARALARRGADAARARSGRESRRPSD